MPHRVVDVFGHSNFLFHGVIVKLLLYLLELEEGKIFTDGGERTVERTSFYIDHRKLSLIMLCLQSNIHISTIYAQ